MKIIDVGTNEKGRKARYRDKSAFLGTFDKKYIPLSQHNRREDMNRTIARITSLPGTIIHWLVLPLFTFVFCLYYRPHLVHDFLSMEIASFSFNATMLFCIILLSLGITRWSLFAIGRFNKFSGKTYVLWCIGETLIASMFSALYLVLLSNDNYTFFEIAGVTFLTLLTTVVYPLTIMWLYFERYVRNQESAAPADENSLIRFYDEYKKLRLVIAHEAVMFIKSEDNYVQIHYLDKNKTKKFILRSSMRALEDDLSKKGLVRCHRSYFINPAYIRIVHRDHSGLIVAELNQDGYESIPISRKYQDDITKLL